MIPSTGSRAMLQLLQRCLQRRDLQASCGVIRRVLSETDSEAAEELLRHRYVAQTVDLGLREAQSHPVADHDAATTAWSGSSSQLRPASAAILAHVTKRMQRWEDALVFAARMDKAPSPDFLASLVRPGNWAALQKTCYANGWSISLPRVLQRIASDYGRWSEALQIALAAERNARRHQSPPSERYSLAVLIPLLAKRADGWALALSHFQSAFSSGSLTDEALCVAILRGCVAAKHWELSLQLFSLMAKAGALPAAVSHKVDEGTIHQRRGTRSLLDDLASISPSWRVSLGLLDAARGSDAQPSSFLLQRVLVDCDAAGKWSIAAQVFDSAVRDGFLDELGEKQTYTALVRAFHRASEWRRAIEAVSWMTHASEAAAMAGVTELVELCEASGQWDVAMQLGETLLGSHSSSRGTVSARTYLSLIFACGKGLQWESSVRVYDHMLRTNEVVPHPLAACSVLQACCDSNAWAAGLGFFDRVRSAAPLVVLPPLSITIATKLAVASGQWHRALLVLDVMLQEGLPMDNHGQRLGLWASALCGSWIRSLAHYSKISPQQHTPSDKVVVRTATRFAGPLASAMVMKHLQRR